MTNTLHVALFLAARNMMGYRIASYVMTTLVTDILAQTKKTPLSHTCMSVLKQIKNQLGKDPYENSGNGNNGKIAKEYFDKIAAEKEISLQLRR